MFQQLETTLVAVYFWKRLAYWSGLRIMCSSDKTMRYLCDELPTLLSCARGPREGIRLYPYPPSVAVRNGRHDLSQDSRPTCWSGVASQTYAYAY